MTGWQAFARTLICVNFALLIGVVVVFWRRNGELRKQRELLKLIGEILLIWGPQHPPAPVTRDNQVIEFRTRLARFAKES